MTWYKLTAEYLDKTDHVKSAIKDYMADLGYDMNRTIEEIRPTYKFQGICQRPVRLQ